MDSAVLGNGGQGSLTVEDQPLPTALFGGLETSPLGLGTPVEGTRGLTLECVCVCGGVIGSLEV